MRSALLGLHERVRPLAVPPLGDERVAARAPPASPARQVVANRAMAAAEIAAYCASSDYAGLSQYCENFELDLRHTEVDLTESVGIYKVDDAFTCHPHPTTARPPQPPRTFTCALTATLTTTNHQKPNIVIV